MANDDVSDEARWESAGRLHPGLARVVRRVVHPLVKVAHRPTLSGEEHLLPGGQAFLLVANHSAGIGLSELVCFLALYMRQVGAERLLAGFALPASFRFWPFNLLQRSLGCVPSTYEAASAALGRGVPLLVFPGGNHETLRPIWQWRRVDFGGRVGFLRIARQHDVPIVPMGITGSHWSAPMVWRSRWLASALILPRLLFNIKRWGISVLGIAGALLLALYLPAPWWMRGGAIWVWLSSPLIFTPWLPTTIRFRIGAPLTMEELFKGAQPDEGWEEALRRVEAEVSALAYPSHKK